MIRSISIKNLRGIKAGSIDGMTSLNVFVGSNNSGKSTVLDAILIGASPNPNQALQTMPARRPGLQPPHRWLLFRERGSDAESCLIRVETSSGETREAEVYHAAPGADSPLQATTPRPRELSDQQTMALEPLKDVPMVRLVQPFLLAGQPNLPDLFSEVAERGLSEKAKAIVRDLRPEIENIQILTQGGQPTIFLESANGATPLDAAGDGVRLLLRISLELAAPDGSIILLEEPEVHLHPGAIQQMARAIFAAIQRSIQVFVTTHSLDLIDALLSVASAEDQKQLTVYRLQLEGGALKCHRLDGHEACAARTQIKEDLR